jgi:hypothetical protein
MKPLLTTISAVGLLSILATVPASAQTPTTRKAAPILHVHDKYSSCFFDLHPELTAAEFKQFAGELGSVLRSRQLGDTATLGKGRFDISVQYTRSPIDDSKGAWNNTMSHPTADHYLGSALEFPRLVARVGVSDSVDLGAWGGLDPHANYGLAGIDSKVVLMKQGPNRPVSLSIRPSVSSLFGPAELWAANASIDVSVGRAFGPFSPYVGVATSASVAVERSNDVDLDPAWADGSVAYAGISYGWRGLHVTAEVEKGTLTSYGFRLGKRF